MPDPIDPTSFEKFCVRVTTAGDWRLDPWQLVAFQRLYGQQPARDDIILCPSALGDHDTLESLTARWFQSGREPIATTGVLREAEVQVPDRPTKSLVWAMRLGCRPWSRRDGFLTPFSRAWWLGDLWAPFLEADPE